MNIDIKSKGFCGEIQLITRTYTYTRIGSRPSHHLRSAHGLDIYTSTVGVVQQSYKIPSKLVAAIRSSSKALQTRLQIFLFLVLVILLVGLFSIFFVILFSLLFFLRNFDLLERGVWVNTKLL